MSTFIGIVLFHSSIPNIIQLTVSALLCGYMLAHIVISSAQ